MRFARQFRQFAAPRASLFGAVGAGLMLGAVSVAAAAEQPVQRERIASYIDHTLLAANATPERLEKLCKEAREYRFRTVCVNAANVAFCVQRLWDTDVGVCAVVGFPLGATTSEVKAFEARSCIAQGADEIDMVINVGALLSGDLDTVKHDIQMVRVATHGHTLKVILETCLLTPEQIATVSRICSDVGVDFVKTSTGFSTGGARLEDVALMKRSVDPRVQVKASGGVKTYEQAKAMIDAGATRIGTSSGVDIVNGSKTVSDSY